MPTLEEVRERDQNRCARCGSPEQLHVHHRRRRSQGGGEAWANLVTLCSHCHDWVHLNPLSAVRAGWLLIAGDDPALIAVAHFAWPAFPVWLGDDGGIVLVR